MTWNDSYCDSAGAEAERAMYDWHRTLGPWARMVNLDCVEISKQNKPLALVEYTTNREAARTFTSRHIARQLMLPSFLVVHPSADEIYEFGNKTTITIWQNNWSPRFPGSEYRHSRTATLADYADLLRKIHR